MAQVKKEKVRRAILAAARDEFEERGYQKASMREISAKAACTLSNVYNYFASKDALFLALVQPCLDDLFITLQRARQERPPAGEVLLAYEQRRAFFTTAIDFIDRHRGDLVLLVLKSEGSSAYQMRQTAVETYETVWFHYLDYVRETFPERRLHPVSRFFVHNIAGFYFNILVAFLREEVPREEMQEYVEELLEYAHGGLRALLQPEAAHGTAEAYTSFSSI